jgi:hypothetical protein
MFLLKQNQPHDVLPVPKVNISLIYHQKGRHKCRLVYHMCPLLLTEKIISLISPLLINNDNQLPYLRQN